MTYTRPGGYEGRKEKLMDFSIYKTQWGVYADEMRWACESNKNGMIYATFHTYEQAAAWCNKKGYSHN